MRRSVIRGPRKSVAERIGSGGSLRVLQLLLHVLDEVSLRDFQPAGMSGVADCAEKFEVSEPTDVVEIERVAGVAGAGDVGVGPMRRSLQIKIGIRLLHCRGQRAIRR